MRSLHSSMVLMVAALLVAGGVASVSAQSTTNCPLVESATTEAGLLVSLFGAGAVSETTSAQDGIASLAFTMADEGEGCSPAQPVILIVDAANANETPPYEINVNGAHITFSGQLSFAILPDPPTMSLSVLRGFAMLATGEESNLMTPVGYSMYIALNDDDGTAGFWNGQSPMTDQTRAQVQAVATENPELAIHTPSQAEIHASQEAAQPTTVDASQSNAGGASGSNSGGGDGSGTPVMTSSEQNANNNGGNNGTAPAEGGGDNGGGDNGAGDGGTPPEQGGGTPSTNPGSPSAPGSTAGTYSNLPYCERPGVICVVIPPPNQSTADAGPNPCNGCIPFETPYDVVLPIDPVVDPFPYEVPRNGTQFGP